MSETVSLVLPIYHPRSGWEKNTAPSIAELRTRLTEDGITLHVFLVNDGSPTSCYSHEALEAVRRAAGGNFDFLSYDSNHGKGYCLRYGVTRTTSDFTVYTDSDFPFDWTSVAQAVEQLRQGADVVMGNRNQAYGSKLTAFRRFLSWSAKKLNHFLLGIPAPYLDAQSGLKAFNEKGRTLFLQTKVNEFLFDTEFILLCWKHRLKIDVIPLTVSSRIKLSRMSLKVAFRELRRLFGILWRIRILGGE